ncbi:threonine ammonia-lyase [Microbaculum marinisediminis]|uniref:Threonine ammonia-lyase n=1 Tax=Microbaculum marinisediminis TaxID=2931392 RepID=A0AAW5R342_9HYPH|nr:threonine ammonia-lyase [Microbaculum sp. A6E488]MCT8973024.1 threonine ammonia-lyase [Microbaculum sp. A6E488]
MSAELPISLEDVAAAAETIRGHVLRTPLVAAPRLSAMSGAEVFVKYENLQVTNAFKERGALNKLAALTDDERERGVVALSAGNHAQALACHARRLGIPATIVMPRTTPFTKIASTESFGARVVLEGETVGECGAVVDALIAREGLVLVHPYDDPLVMAGQGTIGLEMLEDQPDLDCLIVPIGGGGLVSGIAVAATAVKPGIEVVGVQAAQYASMAAALAGKEAACGGDTLAEGIAVKAVPQTAVSILTALGVDVMVVDEAAIERAIYAYLVRLKTLAEGAGAAGLAALLSQPGRFEGRKVGLVLTGGNIDPRLLSAITVRALEHEDRVVTFRVTVRDRPGELGRVADIFGREGANILEVSHQRLLLDVPAMRATTDITIETRDGDHADRIRRRLEAEGMTVTRLAPLQHRG